MPDRLPGAAALTLRTGRLRLRPVEVADAPLLWPHVGDREITRSMLWEVHRDLTETRRVLRSMDDARKASRGVTWAIFEEGAFRGLCGLDGITRLVIAARTDQAELGYWLGRPFHGRGLATEAAGAVVAAGFSRLGLHKVRVRAWSQNEPSLRVIGKLGFREVGLLRQDVHRRGRWHDVRLFEMLADDPAARRLQSAASRRR